MRGPKSKIQNPKSKILIALTGTPGTGKSSVARELRRMGCRVIDIGRIIRLHRFYGRYDRKRGVYEADLRALWKHLETTVKSKIRNVVFLQGHLSHLLPVDTVVLLRCDPDVLRVRLLRRGWRAAKVRENVEAEMVDVIKFEAVERHGPRKMVEIDTTRLTPAEVAGRIAGLVRAGGK